MEVAAEYHGRVLHIIDNVGRNSFGAGSAALQLARRQKLDGLPVAVWSNDRPDDPIVTEVGCVRCFETLGPASLHYSPQMERAARDEGLSYEVMHQHGLWTAVSRVGNIWQRASGRPWVLSTHGYLIPAALARSRWKKRAALVGWDRRMLGMVNAIVATSPAEAEQCRWFGLKQPIAIVPPGLDEKWVESTGDGARFRSECGLPPDRRLMLFLSRVHPHKQPELIVQAMAELGRTLSEWDLVLAGPDESGQLGEVMALAEQNGLADRVHYVGPVFGQAKRDAAAACEMFVLPSRSENFGFAIGEALAASLPVITTTTTPWQDIVAHECGWLVEPTAEGVRSALEQAASLPAEKLKAMGRAGRELVMEKYSWRRTAAMTLELYDWLCGRIQTPGFVQE